MEAFEKRVGAAQDYYNRGQLDKFIAGHFEIGRGIQSFNEDRLVYRTGKAALLSRLQYPIIISAWVTSGHQYDELAPWIQCPLKSPSFLPPLLTAWLQP